MSEAPGPRLGSLPSTFPATVAALHRVAEPIVSPARKPAGEISLVATPGGFGTPVFDHAGVRHQVRVDGRDLVHRAGGEERRARLTTLGNARRMVAELLPAGVGVDGEALDVDPAAARALAEWYAFGAAVLQQLVAVAVTEDAATPVRLWPEHFDIAIELVRSMPAGARTSGSRRVTIATRSPMPTSVRGPRRSRAGSGRRTTSAGPS